MKRLYLLLLLTFSIVFTACSGADSASSQLGSQAQKVEVGSYIVFGSYEQDNDESNGKEPIEWLVLAKEGNKALLIGRYVLDSACYNTTLTDVVWKQCTLRRWLNNGFLNEAFNSNEQTRIQFTELTGEGTLDQVFILDEKEAEMYFKAETDRKCSPTNYAISEGVFKDSGYGTCGWWLRSKGLRNPKYYNYLAMFIYIDGSICEKGTMIDNDRYGVRPAIWIYL